MSTAVGVREFGHHPAKSKKYGEKNQRQNNPGSPHMVIASKYMPQIDRKIVLEDPRPRRIAKERTSWALGFLCLVALGSAGLSTPSLWRSAKAAGFVSVGCQGPEMP